MIVLAHAGHWLVQLLYVVPVLFVVAAIVWSKIQERREEAEEAGNGNDVSGRG